MQHILCVAKECCNPEDRASCPLEGNAANSKSPSVCQLLLIPFWLAGVAAPPASSNASYLLNASPHKHMVHLYV